MALELRDCTFNGPALPEPFVKFQLERELSKRNLLAKTTGAEGRALEDRWDVFRRKLRQLGEQGGDRRVGNHVLEPLVERLGYSALERKAEVITREGAEDGGWLFTTAEGQRLRAWTVSLGTDLDAPNRRGRAYRFSPSRVAQRVLLASGERMGLLSDGEELRILLCDPARPDSHISIRLDRAGGWRAARALPDSYRLLLALAAPAGVAALPDLTEAARLAQSSVTKKLRLQARRAIEGFLQEVLEHPTNAQALADRSDRQQLAQQLWSEGLITVYRLLFVFKLESSADPARAFSFAATSLWRNTYSPNTALAHWVRRVLDEGKDSGGFLEAGLRTLWQLFAEGMSSSELEIKPLGGMLFGRDATPLLGQLQWGEQAVARLLDALLWTPGEGVTMRERVHYGALDVEDLGRVYESLLELEPGISSEPMCRLRRAKLEVVVPVAQGNTYRSNPVQASDPEESGEDEEEGDEDEPAPTRGRAASGSKTKVEFIEEIAADRFFLRVGLGRKASGSYYTPHPFVRFLVQETLGVLLAECSPRDNPQPLLILKLKVLDAAMGSGHFLVEACRFLGEGLYEACRLCDELAVQAEEQAEKTEGAERETLLAKVAELRKRVEDLPDPNNELLAYLPSRAAEGEESGLSQKKAEAMCRRLVAVHCLYGVDKNPLAVELAKLSIWLESYAEGLPLTFLDHRLICGDSLTGPFFEHLLTYPKSGQPLDDLFAQGLSQRLEETLAAVLVHVRDLEASVGKDLADLNHKELAKQKLDEALAPLKMLAAAWSGGVMLGNGHVDAAYKSLVAIVAKGESIDPTQSLMTGLREMIHIGSSSLSFESAFPEVFYRASKELSGFDAVLGNPPWEVPSAGHLELVSAFDLSVSRSQGHESSALLERAMGKASIVEALERAETQFNRAKSGIEKVAQSGRGLSELSAAFLNRMIDMSIHAIGVVMPSSFRRNKTQAWLRKRLLEGQDCEALRVTKIAGYINKKRLFADLPPVLQYDLVVAMKEVCSEMQAGFGMTEFEALFEPELPTVYPYVAIKKLNPGLFIIAEIPSSKHAKALAAVLQGTKTRASAVFNRANLALSQEVNQRSMIGYCIRLPEGVDARDHNQQEILNKAGTIPLLESKSIYQFTANWEGSDQSTWNPVPQHGYLLHQRSAEGLAKAKQILKASPYYRLILRETCGSPHTNERSVIAAILPPGQSAFHSAIVEQDPYQVCNSVRLAALSVLNSFVIDFVARPQIGAHLSLFILEGLPWPLMAKGVQSFLAHSALRLSSNHSGYLPLWKEQINDCLADSLLPQSWPAIDAANARLSIRSAIDAVIAQAFGLSRSCFEDILSTFGHRSCPSIPYLCLEAFDELEDIGLEDFIQRHDPYWEIPLKENLPQPVIELSIPGQAAASLGPLFDGASSEAVLPTQPPIRTAASSTVVPTRPEVAPVSSTSIKSAFTMIADLLHSRGVITSSDAQQATGLDSAGVRPHLQQLVQMGLAVTEGQRRGMRYRRVDG